MIQTMFKSKSEPCPRSLLAAFLAGAFLCLGNLPASAQTTNATLSPAPASPARLDFNSFKLIADRNIFNPRRSGYVAKAQAREIRRTDFFALVGTMSYEKGPFAFFEGSSTELSKVLKPTESIGGYLVTDIQPGSVKLSSGTNVVEMPVGMQMQREQGGTWRLAERAEPVFVSRGDRSGQSRRGSEGAGTNSATDSNDLPGGPGGDGAPTIVINGETITLPLDGAPPGPPIGVFPLPPQAEPAPTATTTARPAATGSAEDALARMRQRAAAERGESP